MAYKEMEVIILHKQQRAEKKQQNKLTKTLLGFTKELKS